MKIKSILLFLLLTLGAQAKFLPATIVFKDGHLEEGFVKSFLENQFIDMKIFDNSIEHELNLDDKTITFKNSEKGESRTLNIDDIAELRFPLKSGEVQTFRALYYKRLKPNGEIIDKKKRIWMPCIILGNRINMYGFEAFSMNGGGADTKFYLGRADEDYVIDLLGSINLFNAGGKFNDMYVTYYNELFKDCPEYAKKAIDMVNKPLTKAEKKAAIENYREKKKALKKTSKKSEEETMFEEYLIPNVEKMIDDYEKECPVK